MGNKIHKTASIDKNANIGEGVEIAEHVIIRQNVNIEDDVYIGPGVVVEGDTTIGAGTKIFQYSAIGLPPQDLKYSGEPTKLQIGKGNTIREFASIHRGTIGGNGVTTIGNNNLLMAYVHVAHDCILGDNLIIANAAQLGGHVIIEDKAVIGGHSAIHQFIHVGQLSMVGASSLVLQDVLPFGLVHGIPARFVDINRIGMRRNDYTSESINSIHIATKIIARSRLSLKNAVEQVKEKLPKSTEVKKLLEFIENRSNRGILKGNPKNVDELRYI